MIQEFLLVDPTSLVEELSLVFDLPTAETLARVMSRTVTQAHMAGVATKRDVDRLEAAIERLVEAQQHTEERMDRLEAAVERLAEAQQRTEERMDRLEAAVERLAEAQQRTEAQVQALAEAQRRTEERVDRLEAAVERLEAAVERLAEAQRRTEERVDRLEAAVERLAEAQSRTQRAVDRLARQVGGLSETVGGDIEDIAYIVLHDVLQREFGWRVGPLQRTWQTWDGRPEEVNLFGQASDPAQPERTIWIVGEAKHNLTLKQVERFARQVERARHHLAGELFPVCFCYRARPEVQERLQELGIRLVFSYGRMA